jgi:hypothetical protein
MKRRSKMPVVPAPEVAALLREFGQRTALRGGNPYRAKAYTRAAENLLTLTEPLEDVIGEGRLKEIPGVGDAIADIITKLHKTGDHPSLQAMRKEMPAGALEMLGIPGLRPDKVLKIYKDLGISSLEELEKAAKEDRLKPVKGLVLLCRLRSCRASRSGARARGSVICTTQPGCSVASRSNCDDPNCRSTKSFLPGTSAAVANW